MLGFTYLKLEYLLNSKACSLQINFDNQVKKIQAVSVTNMSCYSCATCSQSVNRSKVLLMDK